MRFFLKPVTRYISLALSSLLLLMLLAACGNSGSASSSNVTPTPKPPVPTPTPAVTMQAYTGTNFSISYPQGWQKNASGNQVTFADPISKNIITIVTVANPAGAQSASALADATLPVIDKTLLSDAKVATVTPTVTLGSETWAQRSATGNLAITDPGTVGTLMMLVDNHPANAANTQAYEIYYYGPSTTFAQADALAFQPMLQTFKFVA